MDGISSNKFKVFEKLCVEVFNIIRKNVSLIFNFFELVKYVKLLIEVCENMKRIVFICLFCTYKLDVV